MPLLPTVPELVSDINLKRARTTVTEGGQEKEAIQVTQVGGTPVDLSPITDALGTTTDSSADNTVIGLLKSNQSEQQSILYDVGNCDLKLHYIQESTDYIPQMSNNVSDTKDLVNMVNNTLGTVNSDTSSMVSVLGATSTSATAPTSNGPINGRLRQISTVQGTKSDAAWSGSGDGTVIALLKGIYNKL